MPSLNIEQLFCPKSQNVRLLFSSSSVSSLFPFFFNLPIPLPHYPYLSHSHFLLSVILAPTILTFYLSTFIFSISITLNSFVCIFSSFLSFSQNLLLPVFFSLSQSHNSFSLIRSSYLPLSSFIPIFLSLSHTLLCPFSLPFFAFTLMIYAHSFKNI
jgi:hypothetical protein